MYSTHNEGKPVVSERFIRALKIRFISTWKLCQKCYFDVFDYIVDKCNKTYYKTIKMKPKHVNSNSYNEYNVDSN